MINKILLNKYIAYTIAFIVGFSAVIILFSMFENNEKVKNDKTDTSNPITQIVKETTTQKSDGVNSDDTTAIQTKTDKNVLDNGSQTEIKNHENQLTSESEQKND